MDRVFLVLGAVSALLSVAAGAFGAHALRDKLPPDLLDVFQTGATYQMYHALALIAIGLVLSRSNEAAGSSFMPVAGWLFVAGTVLFSGSLYALSLSGTRWLGAITPLGGLAFLAGWAIFAFSAWRG